MLQDILYRPDYQISYFCEKRVHFCVQILKCLSVTARHTGTQVSFLSANTAYLLLEPSEDTRGDFKSSNYSFNGYSIKGRAESLRQQPVTNLSADSICHHFERLCPIVLP